MDGENGESEEKNNVAGVGMNKSEVERL